MKRILMVLIVLSCMLLSACNSTSVGIIGGSDGPTSIFVGEQRKGDEKRPVRMIKVDGKLYYDSGRVSDVAARCGTLDGSLKKVGKANEIPKNNNECNFDGAEGYQNTTSITKEVPVGGEWVIFKLFDDPELDMSVYKYCYYLKGRLPNAERDTEIVALTEDAEYDIQDYFGMLKSYVGPDYGKYKTTFRYYGDADKWGITLSAKNVTNTGLTVLVEQFGGSAKGELQTGAAFSLEVIKDEKWQPVDEEKLDIAWDQIAYLIKKNDITELNLNWELIYGELPPGHYRMKKEFADFVAMGDVEEEVYILHFSIE